MINAKRDEKAIKAGSYTSTIATSTMTTYAYGMWVNNTTNYPTSSGYPSAGICGTISAAGLMAYYDDYVYDSYVPSSLRIRFSSNPGTLITTLYSYIDALCPSGTVYTDVRNGINSYLASIGYYGAGHYAIGGTTTWTKAKSEISSGYPLCIGLLSALGSTYGNHWVLAYQYLDSGSSYTSYYKVVDNHGSASAVVSVNWTLGYVCVSR